VESQLTSEMRVLRWERHDVDKIRLFGATNQLGSRPSHCWGF